MSGFAINNFIHLLTAVVWIGGMIYTNMVFMPSPSVIEPAQRRAILDAVAIRFTIILWASILILLVGGFFKTPGGMLFSASSSYGLMITVKHLIFFVMILFGSLITFKYAPILRTKAPKPDEIPSAGFLNAQKMLRILSGANMTLGIAVLYAVAMY